MDTTKTTKDAAPETGAEAETETDTGGTNDAKAANSANSAKETSGTTAEAETAGHLEVVDETEYVYEAGDDDAADDDDADVVGDDLTGQAAPSARSAIITGAASVAGAALALSSLTGTWLSNVVSQRQGLIGQIKTSSGTAKEQIAAGYGTPWHAIALVNGIFAIVALIVCGGVLLLPASRARAARGHWSQALAWGGVVLAVIGLLIAGAMWFDLFADLPVVPAA
jgi:hypothetical protein